jgi:acid phosphatase
MHRLTRHLLRFVLVLLVAIVAASIGAGVPTRVVAAGPPHIMVVLMENHSIGDVAGNPGMPFVNGLLAANGSVSNADLSHPSLPNYLGLVSGSIHDNPQDTTPQDGTYPGPQLTDELAASGIGWKAYMEDMPVPCDLTDQYGPGGYDVNHNPFMYFSSVRNVPSQCSRDVPYPQLSTDLSSGTAPPFLWVSPNTTNDMHDGTPQQGDAFLQALVTRVKASRWWNSASRIIITWDEGETTDQVLTLVVGSAHGTAASAGNHYGTLRGLEEAYGVGLLGHAADAGVGDLLPLLTGGSPPPPPPASPPRTSVSPSPSPPAQTPTATASPTEGSTAYVRGVYGKDSSPSGWDLIAASGFNTVMVNPYREELDPLPAKGLKGIVWLGAWLKAPKCAFESDDATIRSQLAAIAGNRAILAYYLGDEPRVSECPNAPTLFRQRSDLVHALDPGSTTFTVIQAYENGISFDYAPWAGVVDVIGFDVYPCHKSSSTCSFADIDRAIAAIRKAGITRYWAIVQDFQDCYYRLPTPSEIGGQFDRWAGSGMSGYLVFSWNYRPADPSCIGTTLETQPDNIAKLRYENSRTFDLQPIASHPPAVNRSFLDAVRVYLGAVGWLGLVIAAALGCAAVLVLLARQRRKPRRP